MKNEYYKMRSRIYLMLFIYAVYLQIKLMIAQGLLHP